MNDENDSTASTAHDDSGLDMQERQWAMFAHLSALLAGLLTGWVGLIGCFVGPLVIWLAKKETMPFVDDQGKEALNFNITVAIVFLVLYMLGAVLRIPGFFIVGIAWLVLTILASIKANEGVAYRYPFALRLIK